MTLVWLLWGEDDSPVAAFASRESAEAAALALASDYNSARTSSGGVVHPVTRSDNGGHYTSFWLGEFHNVAVVASMEVQP